MSSQSEAEEGEQQKSSSKGSLALALLGASAIGAAAAYYYYYQSLVKQDGTNNGEYKGAEEILDSPTTTIVEVAGQVTGGFPTYETKDDVIEWLSFYDHHPVPDLIPRALQLLLSGPLGLNRVFLNMVQFDSLPNHSECNKVRGSVEEAIRSID